jgi:two-component system, chemotaxis family, chemotaxis protein CheY
MANILVVDDNIVIRNFLKTILESAGHLVNNNAGDGKQAIDIYVKHKPDLVMLDITMPILNGIEALKRIIEYDPNAKVIMVTALEDKDKIFEAIENGAKQYIVKPINADIVLNKVDKVLNSS